MTMPQRAQLRDKVEKYLAVSNELDDYVVTLLVGGSTYGEVASELGYTRQRVHQLYSSQVAEANGRSGSTTPPVVSS